MKKYEIKKVGRLWILAINGAKHSQGTKQYPLFEVAYKLADEAMEESRVIVFTVKGREKRNLHFLANSAIQSR
jgi:hypothetical protein